MGKQDYSSSDDEEKVVPAKGKAALRKKRRNKPKDYPKRPLSAYNVFFKETRESIIATNSNGDGEKRDHKLDFQTMAKEIASRWKNLEKTERDRVEKLAKKDMLRYRDEVKVYEEEMVKKNREQREEAAAKIVKQEEEAATVAAEMSKQATVRREREDAQHVASLGSGAFMGGGASSLEALSALAAGRYQQGAEEAALQEALLWHQQREMIQRQLLFEELRAAEERELQMRRLQSLGLLQGDLLSGLQAHQLSSLLGGQLPTAGMLQDHSGRGGNAGALAAGGLATYLGGGAQSLLAAGLSPELLLASSGGSLQDAYNLQQQGLLQDHYARLFGGSKEAVGP